MKNSTCLLLRANNQMQTATQHGTETGADAAFEAAALFAMHDGYAIRADRVRATLHDGCALLTGNVQWQYQKDGATRCVQALQGVALVNNRLTLFPDSQRLGDDHGLLT
jgi:osmotically-inducible protein OsmY